MFTGLLEHQLTILLLFSFFSIDDTLCMSGKVSNLAWNLCSFGYSVPPMCMWIYALRKPITLCLIDRHPPWNPDFHWVNVDCMGWWCHARSRHITNSVIIFYIEIVTSVWCTEFGARWVRSGQEVETWTSTGRVTALVQPTTAPYIIVWSRGSVYFLIYLYSLQYC